MCALASYRCSSSIPYQGPLRTAFLAHLLTLCINTQRDQEILDFVMEFPFLAAPVVSVCIVKINRCFLGSIVCDSENARIVLLFLRLSFKNISKKSPYAG